MNNIIDHKTYLRKSSIHKRLAKLIQGCGQIKHEAIRRHRFRIHLHSSPFVVDVESSGKPIQNPISCILGRADQKVDDIEKLRAEHLLCHPQGSLRVANVRLISCLWAGKIRQGDLILERGQSKPRSQQGLLLEQFGTPTVVEHGGFCDGIGNGRMAHEIP